MAKKKKTYGRRRRVGAIGLQAGSTGLKLLSIAAGYLAADTINEQVDKILPKKKDEAGVEGPNQTIAIVGEVGLGGLLLMKRRPTMITTVAGGIAAGAGLKRALKTMGVLKGYQSVPVIGRHRMAGYQSVPVIGKTVVPPQLAGKPGQLQGFRVNGVWNNGYDSQGSGVMGSVMDANANGSGIMNGTGYTG